MATTTQSRTLTIGFIREDDSQQKMTIDDAKVNITAETVQDITNFILTNQMLLDTKAANGATFDSDTETTASVTDKTVTELDIE